MVNRETKQRTLPGSALRGGLLGVAATGGLMYGCAVMIQEEFGLSYDLLEEAVIASAFLGATLAGVVAAKRQGRGVLPAGLAAGAVHFLLLVLLGLTFAEEPALNVMTIKAMVCSAAGAMFGGALCIGKKHKNTKYRK